MRNSKGFTLIQLMMVVVIIGIIAAIAIPNFLFGTNHTTSTTMTNCWTTPFLDGKVVAMKRTTLPDGSPVTMLSVEVGSQSYPCLAGSPEIAVGDSVGTMKYRWLSAGMAPDANVFIAYHLKH